MSDEERLYDIIRMLRQYSARPPLKFPNEAEIPQLAKSILKIACEPSSPWTKWDGDREEIANRAADVWLPLDDLQKVLNRLSGSPLTPVDVEQKIKSLRDPHSGYGRGPDLALQEASLAAYAAEKANGTEFMALLGYMEEWTWGAEEALRRQRDEQNRLRVERDKQHAEARLKSGADCPWTPLTGYADLFCRKNARLFRLKALEKPNSPIAPKFEVLAVKSFEDKRGLTIGHYRTRSDASKALLEVAYKPEW